MYNEAINTNNKIISTNLIANIFSRMNEVMKLYTTRAKKEEQTYDSLPFEEQLNMKRKYNTFVSDFSFSVDFYDSTIIKIDSFEKFIGIFNSRVPEIKSIVSNFSISYFDDENKYHSNSIGFMVYENSFDINVAIDTANEEVVELFDYIKESISKAPAKYDFVMRNKNKICFSYTFASGCFVAIILSTILICIPPVFSVFISGGYWMLFPICCLILGYSLGFVLFSGSINDLYKSIDMEKIYDGYDPNTFESKYKSDKDSYINSSEVIIGKNVHNLSTRKKIKHLYRDKKKYIKYELIAIAVITLILFLLQYLMG